MSTLHTVTSVLVGVVFVFGFLKLILDEPHIEGMGEKFFKYKRNTLTHAFVGIALIILSIIRLIAASKLGYINDFYWISVIPFAVYGVFGIICLVYYAKNKKNKKDMKGEEA